MRFSTVVAASALTGAAMAKDISVGVGKMGNTFNPDTIEAEMGDTVTFKFWPKNHSVAQAAFNTPCQPMPNGAWSGFVPANSSTVAAETTFTMNITDASTPVWLYCSQAMHCQGGMVAVVNPPKQGNRTLEAFKQLAGNATKNESPSSTAGTNGQLTTGSPSPTGAASTLEINSFAFSGVMGMIAYLLL